MGVLEGSSFFVTCPLERRVALDSAIDNYLVEAPLGSTDRRIPIYAKTNCLMSYTMAIHH